MAGPTGTLQACLRAPAALASAVAIAVGFAACGGGDDDSASSEPATLEGVTGCLEDAGAKVEKIKLSFAKLPPDVRADFSPQESATIWVTDSEEQAAEVIDQNEALSKIGNQPAEDHGPPIQIGNAVAEPFLGPLSDDTRAQIETCFG